MFYGLFENDINSLDVIGSNFLEILVKNMIFFIDSIKGCQEII